MFNKNEKKNHNVRKTSSKTCKKTKEIFWCPLFALLNVVQRTPEGCPTLAGCTPFADISWSLWFWYIFWNQEVWRLQRYSSHSRLLWLSAAFCGSIWIWGCFFYFCEKHHWNFYKVCTESVNCLWQCGHVNIIEPSIHECRMSFHWFLSSLISLSNVL